MCLIHDVYFFYENFVKFLYVHCITHIVTKNTLVILNIILSVDKYTEVEKVSMLHVTK